MMDRSPFRLGHLGRYAAWSDATMEIPEFWRLIELIDHAAVSLDDLETELKQLPSAEIESFYQHAADCLNNLDQPNIREQCSFGCSGEGFLCQRLYIIGRGYSFYEKMLTDPQRVTESFTSLLYIVDAGLDDFLMEKGI